MTTHQVTQAEIAARIMKLDPTLRFRAAQIAGRMWGLDQKATYSLPEFFEDTTNLTIQRWQAHLAARLERLAHEEGQRIVIHGPPQHGKTILTSQRFPAWLLGQNPLLRIRLAAYNQEHAEAQSGINIEMMRDPKFIKAFPDWKARIPNVVRTKSWSTLGRAALRDGQWSFKALGLGGGFTGLGVDCFPGETLVWTESGESRIDEINLGQKVWAFDHQLNCMVLRPVEAVREKTVHELVEITTTSGRQFRCTPEHRIYVPGRGYTPASALSAGDSLCAFEHESLSALRRPKELEKKHDLPALLRQAQGAFHGPTHLRVVQEGVPTGSRRSRKEQGKGPHRLLLLPALLKRSPRGKKYASLRAVWWAAQAQPRNDGQILQYGLQQGGADETETQNTVRALRGTVSSQECPKSLLLSGVQKFGSLRFDAREWQFSFSGGQKLHQMVRGNAAVHSRARRLQVRVLHGRREEVLAHVAGPDHLAHQPFGAPYQRRCIRQQGREPRYGVQEVPRDSPQVHRDTVAMVRRLRPEDVRVYDIQVEGCHNFFANQVLVHNCLIIDDIYKDRVEAYSEATNRQIWGWWEDVVFPRLNRKTNIIVMMHRWWNEDFPGRLLATGDWEEIRYAARVDNAQDKKDDPLGRELGELLSHLTDAALLDKMRKSNPVGYLALQIGRPTAVEGNMFKEAMVYRQSAVDKEKFEPWPMPDFSHVEEALIIWDTANKAKRENDMSAGALLCRIAGYIYIIPLFLDRVEVPELEVLIATTWAEWRSKLGSALQGVAVEEPTGTAILQNLTRKTDTRARDKRRLKEDPNAEIRPPECWELDAWLRWLDAPEIILLPFAPPTDKVTNASSVISYFRARKFRLCASSWSTEFVGQLKSFPQSKHDDAVDVCTNGARWFLNMWEKAARNLTGMTVEELNADYSEGDESTDAQSRAYAADIPEADLAVSFEGALSLMDDD